MQRNKTCRTRRNGRKLLAFTSAVVVGAFLAVLGVSSPAQAAFPGRDGRIVYVSGDGFGGAVNDQLFSINPDGTGNRQLTHFTGNYEAFAPSWSPDGRTIAFQLHNCCGPDHVDLIDAKGNHLRPVPYDPNLDSGNPAFSPDGKRLVITFETTGWLRLATINLDGTDLRPITPESMQANSPHWSPDGTHIAFHGFPLSRGVKHLAIYTVRPDGTDVRRLTPVRLGAARPDYSPDGRQILFYSHANSAAQSALYLMNADGTDLRRLTRPPLDTNDFHAAFSPAGDRIVFGTSRNGCCDEVTIGIDGTGLAVLVRGVNRLAGPDDADWGPRP